MTNAIFFSLHIDKGISDLWRQTQLHYALKTLHENNTNPNFDVVVFISGESYISNQIKKFYPNTIVVEFEYDPKQYENSYTCAKWECYSKIYDMGYTSALSLDGDVVVRGDVSFIFDKYVDYDYYVILDKMFDYNDDKQPPLMIEGKVINLIKLNGFRAMNSGQILFNIRALETMKKNLHTLSSELRYFQTKFKDYISDKDLSTYKNSFDINGVALWVNEQWAGHNILRKEKLTFDEFDYDDVYQTVVEDELQYGTVLHYIGSINANKIIPTEFWDECERELEHRK